MRVGRRLSGLVIAAALAGCASPEPEPEAVAGVLPGGRVGQGGAMLILSVSDYVGPPETGGIEARNSGTVLSMELRQVLTSYGVTGLPTALNNVDLAYERAAELQCDHILEATIVDWRDARKEWKEAPDRVMLRVRIYDTARRELVAFGRDVQIGGTPVDMRDPPHRLLKRLARKVLDPIFAGKVLDEVPLEPVR